jgi:putative peptidoglycan lipid II flippase
MIALPFSLGAMLYSHQIVQIIYERGAFDPVATAMTSSAFLFYSAGLLFASANELTTKAYYSRSDMKSPMIFAAVSVIINIALSLILIRYMAHGGLALATSIAAICNTVLLWTGIKRKHSDIKLTLSIKKLIKIIAAAVIAIGLSYLVYQFIILTIPHIIFMRTVQLAIPVIIAVIVYLIILKIFRMKELDMLINLLFRK